MGFYDLCIDIGANNEELLRQLLMRLYEMGYRSVAINQTIDENVFETKQKRKKKTQSQPEKIVPLDLHHLKAEFQGKLVILNRITFSYTDPAKTYLLGQSSGLKKFDLYAIIPKNQAALQFACTQLNADIITINASCTGLKFNRKLYMQAIERGLHFEIQYVDLLLPATRTIALQNSHGFHIYGKNKNVIISSGAKNYSLIRNPYDVINVATLLGLSEIKAKASIHAQCKRLLSKAEGRRNGKAIFAIQPASGKTFQNDDEYDDNDKTLDSKKLKLSNL